MNHWFSTRVLIFQYYCYIFVWCILAFKYIFTRRTVVINIPLLKHRLFKLLWYKNSQFSFNISLISLIKVITKLPNSEQSYKGKVSSSLLIVLFLSSSPNKCDIRYTVKPDHVVTSIKQPLAWNIIILPLTQI